MAQTIRGMLLGLDEGRHMVISPYGWLVLGAVVGAIGVIFVPEFLGGSIPGWAGALIPTICAIIGAFIGPQIGTHVAPGTEPPKARV